MSSGCDAALEVRQDGIAGRGVFATGDIPKGSWVCEYKTSRVFDRKEKESVEREYNANGEGSYIVESAHKVPNAGYLCFDATRKFHQFGRYINHAHNANVAITPPLLVRGKWRIGFISVRDIRAGDEVVWDYLVTGEDWSGCKLVDGVVRPSKKMIELEEKRNVEELSESQEADNESEVAFTPRIGRRARRRLCYCPIEGCTSRPLAKLSNHLSQVHHLTPKERAKYLGLKRKFASEKDIVNKVKRTTLRRSQRTLPSLLRCSFKEMSDSESDHLHVSSFESDVVVDDSVCLDNIESEMETDESATSALLSMQLSDDAIPENERNGSKDFVSDSVSENESDVSLHRDCSVLDPTPDLHVPDEDTADNQPSTSVIVQPPITASRYGRTDSAGRFPLDTAPLVSFSAYLTSRSGGMKTSKQANEICTDVSKYLYFANPSACFIEYLYSRVKIRQFVSSLEAGGVGPSGILSKLRRIVLAIQWHEVECEDCSNEREILERTSVAKKMIANISTTLTKDKNARQVRKLESFSRDIPDLSQVGSFMTSADMDAVFRDAVSDARNGLVSTEVLKDAMMIIAGRLMLR